MNVRFFLVGCFGALLFCAVSSSAMKLDPENVSFTDLADAVVLWKRPLADIKASWNRNLETLSTAIMTTMDDMPQTGSASMKDTNKTNIKNAEKNLKAFSDQLFKGNKINPKEIEKVRSSISVKSGPTMLGGDATGTKKIKTSLRNALLELKRVAQYAQPSTLSKPVTEKKPVPVAKPVTEKKLVTPPSKVTEKKQEPKKGESSGGREELSESHKSFFAEEEEIEVEEEEESSAPAKKTSPPSPDLKKKLESAKDFLRALGISFANPMLDELTQFRKNHEVGSESSIADWRKSQKGRWTVEVIAKLNTAIADAGKAMRPVEGVLGDSNRKLFKTALEKMNKWGHELFDFFVFDEEEIKRELVELEGKQKTKMEESLKAWQEREEVKEPGGQQKLEWLQNILLSNQKEEMEALKKKIKNNQDDLTQARDNSLRIQKEEMEALVKALKPQTKGLFGDKPTTVFIKQDILTPIIEKMKTEVDNQQVVVKQLLATIKKLFNPAVVKQ